MLREDTEEQFDDDVYTVTVGRSPADPRLRNTSFLLTPANSDLGEVIASGPIADVLEPDQKGPPGAARYALFEQRSTVVSDDKETEHVTRLWIAEDSRLPLKRTIDEGHGPQALVVSYGKSRSERHELPQDWFATPRPAASDEQRVDLGPEEPPAEETGEMPREEAIAMARSQRALFGMNTDLVHVTALHDDPSTAGTTDLYGFPVTQAERAEFELRGRLESLMPQVDAYGLQFPDTYGGVHFESLSGRIIVRFTRDLELHVTQLRAQLPVGARIEGRLATHTLQHLTNLERRLHDDVGSSGRLFNEPVSYWGVRLDSNNLRLVAPQPTLQFRASVAIAYGPAVLVEVGEDPIALRGSYQQGVDPVRGGQLAGLAPNRKDCSLSFPGRADRRRNGRTRRVDVVLTNSHCGGRGATWYTEDKRGNPETVGVTYAHVRGVDVAAVALDIAAFGSRRGGIYLREERDRARIISHHRPMSRAPRAGTRVCVAAGGLRFDGDSGDTYGRNICGDVEGFANDPDEDPDHWMGIRISKDRCYSVGGSSGSPVYRREDDENLGVGVMFGGDAREGCSKERKTAKIVTVSVLPDVQSRVSTYIPNFVGPR
jgi:hypothetical protein